MRRKDKRERAVVVRLASDGGARPWFLLDRDICSGHLCGSSA